MPCFPRLSPLIVLAGLLGTSTSALAQDGHIRQDVVLSRVSALDLARVLNGMNLAFTQSTAPDGTPKFTLELEGLKVWLATYGCDEGGCKSYQLTTGMAMSTPPSAESINEWNRTKRFGKAHLDASGNPHLIYDLDVEGGISVGVIEEHVRTYQLLLRAFVNHVGWKAD